MLYYQPLRAAPRRLPPIDDLALTAAASSLLYQPPSLTASLSLSQNQTPQTRQPLS